MNKSAFRFQGELYCTKHFPGNPHSVEERRVIKREALLGQECLFCGVPFLEDGPEPDPLAEQRRFRKNFEADVRAGRAYPMAGDLFDKNNH